MDRLTFSDERLMSLAAGGDEQAFQALIRRTGAAILTVISRMVGGGSAGEEAFVDVVTKIWTGRASYASPRPVRPWIMAIAANACREQFRRAGYARASGYLDDQTASASHRSELPEAGLASGERAARVASALARLPEKQREVLVLRVCADLEYTDIAEALGVSEGTARSNMHHALTAMRRMLGNLRDLDGEPSTRPAESKIEAKARGTNP